MPPDRTSATRSACAATSLARTSTIEGSALREFDDVLRSALERIVGVPLHAEVSSQSSLGVRAGGLSIRQATDCAR
jgi:hypothetical protein